MHKKIKYIIATTLIIGSISGVLPANNFIPGTRVAYASTYKHASTGELSSLTVSTGSNELKLRDTYTGDEVSLSEKTEYYLLLKGSHIIDINAEVKGSGYVVKTFTSSSKTAKGQDVGEDINVDSTYKDIYLRIYKSEAAYEVACSNEDVSDCEKTYVIHAKRSTAVTEAESDREYAYLTNIHLSNGSISFSKNQTSYDVNVDEDVDKITVRATPEDDEDSVEINKYYVDKDHDFETTVNLDKGNNTISIYVQNDDEDTTYTLNVYRGKLASTGTSSNDQDITIQTNGSTLNAWQSVDGKWRYIDGSGAVLKNKWWYDSNTQKNYYLKEDGYRATGWFANNNNWYYFNGNGEMQTGWVNVDKNWYYLNAGGAMQMGWLEDSAGNWYCLDNSGAMKTGWIENSDGKWYYLDSSGKMIKNSTINGSTLDSNGVLVN